MDADTAYCLCLSRDQLFVLGALLQSKGGKLTRDIGIDTLVRDAMGLGSYVEMSEVGNDPITEMGYTNYNRLNGCGQKL